MSRLRGISSGIKATYRTLWVVVIKFTLIINTTHDCRAVQSAQDIVP